MVGWDGLSGFGRGCWLLAVVTGSYAFRGRLGKERQKYSIQVRTIRTSNKTSPARNKTLQTTSLEDTEF
ncbi:unnamed protein product [Ceratitis capitata]|uniref:(Mediterranean fruit fly) hypothetical protein n=1 Tax=Ceratitis capitata TaxID=7213 RepID=A0A811V9H3_CERCA|nr:unnamed protein product [Ceratitis capitata]